MLRLSRPLHHGLTPAHLRDEVCFALKRHPLMLG